MPTLAVLPRADRAATLGLLLRDFRTELGDSVETVSGRGNRPADDLVQIETGRADLGLDELANAVGSYGIPRRLFPRGRSRVVVDPVGGTISVAVACAASLWVDADRIIQTLTNLVLNAVKFSPPGSVVRLEAHVVEQEARFDVVDQGRGIPPDMLDAVFERFEQVDASDSRARRAARGSGSPSAKHRRAARRATVGAQHARPRQHLLVHAASPRR